MVPLIVLSVPNATVALEAFLSLVARLLRSFVLRLMVESAVEHLRLSFLGDGSFCCRRWRGVGSGQSVKLRLTMISVHMVTAAIPDGCRNIAV